MEEVGVVKNLEWWWMRFFFSAVLIYSWSEKIAADRTPPQHGKEIGSKSGRIYRSQPRRRDRKEIELYSGKQSEKRKKGYSGIGKGGCYIMFIEER